MVDKNLFLYDLAVVAILKNEGHYLKEWLDYHLLAGVEHFYLYDNDSTDNQAEVAKPYIEAGLVDYIPAPGRMMQDVSYNDAVKKFKFQSRYMAFIDLDEFIYPKTNQSIVEVVDEILSRNPNAKGLAINWQHFGSNGQEKADYSRGVLERFTRRAQSDWKAKSKSGATHANFLIKSVVNPRYVNIIPNPHYVTYLANVKSVNSDGRVVELAGIDNVVAANKIVVNHYYTKSYEEFEPKVRRGSAYSGNPKSMETFSLCDRNEVFDDGILRYRAARAENFSLKSDAQRLNRVAEALTKTLSAYADGEIFPLETALTCRALSAYLREKFPADDYWKVCEEASLAAIIKSSERITFTDGKTLHEDVATSWLLIRDLPNLLRLPYPIVKDLRKAALQSILRLKNFFQFNGLLEEILKLDYIYEIFKE